MRDNTDYNVHLFHEGTERRAYEFMGAHPGSKDGMHGCAFRVWAPHAERVYVQGDFNGWTRRDPMEKLSRQGLWEAFVPDVQLYDSYKYEIVTDQGEAFLKADPFAFHAATRPGTDSKVVDLNGYDWRDESWHRDTLHDRPVSIYEVHAGSWRRYADGHFFDYRKLADELIPYVVDMGFTHIELMPLSEYPYDASWGYQVTGFYAATSRYGKPEDLMYLIDCAHAAGLGVLLDWVPGHFPKDTHGLALFDGKPCYEYSGCTKREHKGWGTLVFDWGRTEVQSFLISNALFWIDKYHIDGLRVDAVASMLYLDYDREEHEWEPNSFGGRENLEAVAFLRKLNESVQSEYPGFMMIAEESTAWPMVTLPPQVGGLGFNYKWNMGFMNDTLQYIKTDSYFKQHVHGKMTFSMEYAFTENYILPLSHDEVVHMKGSLISKMPGTYEEKFANLKAYLGYMWTHPGKKLLFMGGEFAQFREWRFDGELDWNLLEFPMHRTFQTYVKDLNAFYRSNEALWAIENDWAGFEWLKADDRGNNVLVYERKDAGGCGLICVAHFSPEERDGYRIGLSKHREYEVVFCSDDARYGGLDVKPDVRVQRLSTDGQPYTLTLTVPPLAFIVLAEREAGKRCEGGTT
jgi:1,4-alpha-glucan branching enzyme